MMTPENMNRAMGMMGPGGAAGGMPPGMGMPGMPGMPGMGGMGMMGGMGGMGGMGAMGGMGGMGGMAMPGIGGGPAAA
jgi:hypothetical protein